MKEIMNEDKKKFEVKIERTKDGFFQRNIYIAVEPGLNPKQFIEIEYEVDEESLKWAEEKGGEILQATKADIQRHFLSCISEVAGKKIDEKEFREALKTGWI